MFSRCMTETPLLSGKNCRSSSHWQTSKAGREVVTTRTEQKRERGSAAAGLISVAENSLYDVRDPQLSQIRIRLSENAMAMRVIIKMEQ
jgi:hypothetical protein